MSAILTEINKFATGCICNHIRKAGVNEYYEAKKNSSIENLRLFSGGKPCIFEIGLKIH